MKYKGKYCTNSSKPYPIHTCISTPKSISNKYRHY